MLPATCETFSRSEPCDLFCQKGATLGKARPRWRLSKGEWTGGRWDHSWDVSMPGASGPRHPCCSAAWSDTSWWQCLLGTARWLGRRNQSPPTSIWRELYDPLIENSHRPPGGRRGVRVPDRSRRRASSPRPVWPTRGQSLARTAARKHPTSWLEVNPGKLVGWWWWTWGCCREVGECSAVPCKRLLSLVACCPLLGTCPNHSGLGNPCKR